jgi:hypothetical protein
MPTLASRAWWLSSGDRKRADVRTICVVNYLAMRRNVFKKYDSKESADIKTKSSFRGSEFRVPIVNDGVSVRVSQRKSVLWLGSC